MVDLYPKKCNLCGGKVVYIENKRIYHGTSYGSGYCYYCTRCGAYVGTHRDRKRIALGILANEEMRKWKTRCHNLFDSYWLPTGSGRQKRRAKLYKKLANALQIPVHDCHFGYFDVPMLQKAYDIIKTWESEDNVFGE